MGGPPRHPYQGVLHRLPPSNPRPRPRGCGPLGATCPHNAPPACNQLHLAPLSCKRTWAQLLLAGLPRAQLCAHTELTARRRLVRLVRLVRCCVRTLPVHKAYPAVGLGVRMLTQTRCPSAGAGWALDNGRLIAPSNDTAAPPLCKLAGPLLPPSLPPSLPLSPARPLAGTDRGFAAFSASSYATAVPLSALRIDAHDCCCLGWLNRRLTHLSSVHHAHCYGATGMLGIQNFGPANGAVTCPPGTTNGGLAQCGQGLFNCSEVRGVWNFTSAGSLVWAQSAALPKTAKCTSSNPLGCTMCWPALAAVFTDATSNADDRVHNLAWPDTPAGVARLLHEHRSGRAGRGGCR